MNGNVAPSTTNLMSGEGPGSPPMYSIQRPTPVVQRVATLPDNVRLNVMEGN
jgi:hypothetical protein